MQKDQRDKKLKMKLEKQLLLNETN